MYSPSVHDQYREPDGKDQDDEDDVLVTSLLKHINLDTYKIFTIL